MIVYSTTKAEFMHDVRDNLIFDKINEQYERCLGKTNEAQKRAWKNSMPRIRDALDSKEIPDDCGIAIEYIVPLTSKRADFILTGFDANNTKTAIIIELKQWDGCNAVDGKDGIVETYIGGGVRETTHPSYQAMSYAALIENYGRAVQNDKIKLLPCAFLHNYRLEEDDPILASQYKTYIENAPIFGYDDFAKFRNYISENIKKGDNGKIIREIDSEDFYPSKSLQDCLANMLKGNQEFVMIDDQKIAFETAVDTAQEALKSDRKKVLVIEGGPGTGKTVLAINLMVKFTKTGLVSFYVTRNGTPRAVFKKKLQGKFEKNFIDSCFQSSGNFVNTASNSINTLVIDEAHRLTEKSGFMSNEGENQIKEIINAAKCSIFFIDGHQRVTLKDIGSIDAIRHFAEEFDADFQQIKLKSQFRCNGSDGYLAWLDNLLEIEQTANFDGMDFDYDIKVFDNPNDMRAAIIEKNKVNNKSRVVAGYCWNWDKNKKNDTNFYDITIPKYNFGMSWNLDMNSQTWAIEKDSVNEAGCIHTCQGLEFDYVGVIIGDDMIYRDGSIITDVTKRAKTDQSIKGMKTYTKNNPEEAAKVADEIVKNTYRVLMTRGMKGCYIFCVDDELRDYLKKSLAKLNK